MSGASPLGAGGLLLGVLFGIGLSLRRRRSTGLAVILASTALGFVFVASPAAAQGFDAQRFDPIPQTRAFTLVRDAAMPGELTLGAQLSINYGLRPLEYGRSTDRSRFGGVIDNLIGMDFGFEVTPLSWLRVGVNFPFLQLQATTDPGSVAAASSLGHSGGVAGIGDLGLEVGFGLLRQGDNAPLSLQLTPRFVFPTGSKEVFVGSGAFGVGGDLAIAMEVPFFHLSGNVGFLVNTLGAPTANLQPDDELRLGLGLGVPLLDGQVEPQAEIVVATVIDPTAHADLGIGPFDPLHTPVEFTVGVLVSPNNGPLFFRVGAGKGIGPGFGTPDLRVFGQVGFDVAPKPPEAPVEPVSAKLIIDTKYNGKRLADTNVDLVDDRGNKQTVTVTSQTAQIEVPVDSSWDGTAARDCLRGTGTAKIPASGGKRTMTIDMEPDRTIPVDFDLRDPEGNVVTDATVRWNQDPNCLGCVPEDKAAIADGKLRQMVCPGEHEVYVEKPGYRLVRSTLTAEPGTLQAVAVEMKPTKIEVTAKKILILEKVYFDFDKDTLQSRSHELLDEVAETIIANPQNGRLEVQGHTDNKGDDGYNLDLSDRRAKRVLTYLVNKGVDAERLVSKGFGEASPIDTNDTDAGRDKNRRVEFLILGN